jgi:hypothetical protein
LKSFKTTSKLKWSGFNPCSILTQSYKVNGTP